MTVREALAAVVRAVYEETDSYGSPADRTKVKTYLEGFETAPFATYLYVGRIPLANFYAHAAQAFNKASLWQEIQDRSAHTNLDQPGSWDASTQLIDLALWVHAHD